MNVASMMSHPVHTARSQTPVADVVRSMTEHRVSTIPVVDDDQKVVGVVTISELVPQTRNAPASNVQLLSLRNEYVDYSSLREAYTRVAQMQAGEVMVKPVVTIPPEAEIGIAAQIMAERAINALPVVRADGVLVGIVTRSDVARMAIHP